MNKKLQLIEIMPDELAELINKGIQVQFDELKKHFQLKEPTEYLTRIEVSKLLSINPTTLWNWTNKGRLKSYGIGGRRYYKRKEIDEMMIELCI